MGNFLNTVYGKALNKTEQKIVEYMSEGLTNQEIADLTGTTVKTVCTMSSMIFRKTGKNSRRDFLLRKDAKND